MKLQRTLLLPALAVAFTAAAFAQTSSKPAEEIPDAPAATPVALTRPNGPTVVMDTTMGRITCQFFQRQAPLAVANFIALAEGTKDWTDPATSKKQHNKPLFNGTVFHRVIPDFMIQGGDPAGNGTGDPGYAFADEFDPNLNFDQPGRLAMANSGPNTNGSQFFITTVPTPHLNQKHTIFGQCDASGLLVAQSIALVQTDSSDKPVTPVVLKKVTIVREGQTIPTVPGSGEPVAHPPTEIVHISRAPLVESAKGVHISSNVVQISLLEQKSEPIYPVDARNAKVSGTVVLDATIGIDGRVKDLKVLSGPALLQQAALEAVRTWHYRPYLLNNKPVEVYTTVKVVFALSK
jgi:peptidyl-prolyl cis-trans isomerase A (cyclophilin A)